jgi:hypothetical protein
MVMAGREVVLSAMNPDCTISDSEWLIMNARGFDSQEAAMQFGRDLRAAIELSSISTRLGIDCGRDLATSMLSQLAKDHVVNETGVILRNNIHGLDVFEDDPCIRIFSMSGTATVLASHNPFLSFTAELHERATVISEEARDVVLLLNYALMCTEPVAQIVFVYSAVEMLGQCEQWSPEQRALLAELARAAECSDLLNARERAEVSHAITKSMHKLTLRQGVLRLLDKLDLAHMKKDWDSHYAERSTLVHGLAPKPGADYSDFASRSMSLCGHILLKAVAAELPIAERHINTFYAIQPNKS